MSYIEMAKSNGGGTAKRDLIFNTSTLMRSAGTAGQIHKTYTIPNWRDYDYLDIQIKMLEDNDFQYIDLIMNVESILSCQHVFKYEMRGANYIYIATYKESNVNSLTLYNSTSTDYQSKALYLEKVYGIIF